MLIAMLYKNLPLCLPLANHCFGRRWFGVCGENKKLWHMHALRGNGVFVVLYNVTSNSQMFPIDMIIQL